ncbi:MerR family transcriptional regulator [Clostridium botulinum]|nr:MerR family transcriptional regulator [Clostridium botulinum]
MKNYFSVGEAAKAVGMTSETLRHYDRIGLVKPSRKDEWTNYRYYTEQDIVRLNTIRALQQMDLPLKRIKEVLEYDDLQAIISFLTDTERKADEKIAELQYSKAKIQIAKADFERKLHEQPSATDISVKNIPRRVIMLSDTYAAPTLDNLWNYLGHFYDKVPLANKNDFLFEDLAGVYIEHGKANMFAVCIHYANLDELKTLPAGKYLCADCTDENKESKTKELLQVVKKDYGIEPSFIVQQIVVSGILQWNYQVQVFLGE